MVWDRGMAANPIWFSHILVVISAVAGMAIGAYAQMPPESAIGRRFGTG